MVRDAVAQARAAGCDLVIACGGGSALDAGKAIAALLGNDGDPLDYLEVVGHGRALERPGVPFIAAPTTAGTGSEVTKNAVLASPEHGVKASLRSPLMLARVAIVDPDLLLGLPPAVIASSGLDALSQLIEPFVSSRANPVTDALAREGIAGRRARCAWPTRTRPGPLRTRAPTFVPNSAPIWRWRAFWAGCAWPTPVWARCTGSPRRSAAPGPRPTARPARRCCRTRCASTCARSRRARPTHAARARFQELAVLLTGSPEATADDGIAWLDALGAALAVPGLSRYGMTAADIPALVQKAKVASSMKANPLPLTDDELTEIATRAL